MGCRVKPSTQCALCPEPHDGWPHLPDGELCQMCWEAECSASYWRAVEAGMRTEPVEF